MSDTLDLRDLADELEALDMQDRAEEPLDDNERDRLKALRDLQGQLFTNNLADYAKNEPTLIPVEDFEDFAKELADSLGYTSNSDDNPLHQFIDWGAWADSLKADYTEVEFDGDTYLISIY